MCVSTCVCEEYIISFCERLLCVAVRNRLQSQFHHLLAELCCLSYYYAQFLDMKSELFVINKLVLRIVATTQVLD